METKKFIQIVGTLAFISILLPGFGPSQLFGIPFEFFIFFATLIGIALLHKFSLQMSIAGLLGVLIFKMKGNSDYSLINHIFGETSLIQQLKSSTTEGEWPILLNLFGLLLGFPVLAKIFEQSGVPDRIPTILPKNWLGPLLLLFIIYMLSIFLDNIAGALLGGIIALTVYKERIHISFLVAIVAASNAGGAGSVIGDTTTTMMWIEGVSAFSLFKAFIGSFIAFLIFGIYAAKIQFKYSGISSINSSFSEFRWLNLIIVAGIVICTILTNVFLDFPALGVWIVLLFALLLIKVPLSESGHAIPNTIFLLCLVVIASMMPVNQLPNPSVFTTFGLGFVSSIFDNIPLTKLALSQGGYDWPLLAFAVGFGGSITWFGSSAGVAMANLFPQLKSIKDWILNGWIIIIAYMVAFLLMFLITGWNPGY